MIGLRVVALASMTVLSSAAPDAAVRTPPPGTQVPVDPVEHGTTPGAEFATLGDNSRPGFERKYLYSSRPASRAAGAAAAFALAGEGVLWTYDSHEVGDRLETVLYADLARDTPIPDQHSTISSVTLADATVTYSAWSGSTFRGGIDLVFHDEYDAERFKSLLDIGATAPDYFRVILTTTPGLPDDAEPDVRIFITYQLRDRQ